MQWIKATCGVVLMVLATLTVASVKNDDLARFDAHPERGWYFYATTTHRAKLPLEHSQRTTVTKKLTPIKKCSTPSTWTADCGFIDPTSLGLAPDAVWHFEQQEYHELLHRYSLFPNNIQEVYHFQKFKYWALTQAMIASYTSQYNREQHPEINASVTAPVSQFGLAVIKQIEQKSETAFW